MPILPGQANYTTKEKSPPVCKLGFDKALFWNNLEPMHYDNAKAKGNLMSFVIAGKRYSVERCPVCPDKGEVGYGITDASSFRRVDWKYCEKQK